MKIVYWLILAGMILLTIILEMVPVLDGLGEKGSMAEFCLQYVLIFLTLVDVYAALKMIRKNPLFRMSLLAVPALATLLCYHIFMNASFGYLTIICAIAFVFVRPADNSDKSLTSNH